MLSCTEKMRQTSVEKMRQSRIFFSVFAPNKFGAKTKDSIRGAGVPRRRRKGKTKGRVARHHGWRATFFGICVMQDMVSEAKFLGWWGMVYL